jgi:hypothetical protein
MKSRAPSDPSWRRGGGGDPGALIGESVDAYPSCSGPSNRRCVARGGSGRPKATMLMTIGAATVGSGRVTMDGQGSEGSERESKWGCGQDEHVWK